MHRQKPSSSCDRSDEPVWDYSLEDTAFTKMEVPVVGASDDQFLLQLRLGGHGNRPQVRTWRSVEVDAARRGSLEEEEAGLCWLRVSADSGGVDGDLHWLLSLYSIGPLRWRARRGRGSRGRAGSAGARCFRACGEEIRRLLAFESQDVTYPSASNLHIRSNGSQGKC